MIAGKWTVVMIGPVAVEPSRLAASIKFSPAEYSRN